MDYRKFAAGLRNAAGSYALFYGAPRGDLEQAADVIEELAAKLEPSNEPLTLDELREMGGEPVFIMRMESDEPTDRDWALVDLKYDMCRTVTGGMAIFELYGATWLAYRRRPEDGKT